MEENIEQITEPSPCVGICSYDNQSLCRGCGRTQEEIKNWKSMSNEEKKACKELCIRRRRFLAYKRGF